MDTTTFIQTPQKPANEWVERCEYWRSKSNQRPIKRKRRERETLGLVITGHGYSITVHRGTLLIKDGLSYFPSTKVCHRYFKGDLSLPPRIVLLDGSGNITIDALDWLSEQKIDLIRLNWDGRIISAINASGYSADKRKVAWQLAARSNEAKRVAFAVPLIVGKVKETLFNLENHLPPSPSRETAIKNAKLALATLKSKPPKSVSKLLAIEGTVAQGYFFAWRVLALKWRALGRHPVPEEWNRYFSRSSLKADVRLGNRHATHPINAMLNYAYTILESAVRINSVRDGYDPSVGIMHDNRNPDRHSFVFDLMEPQRPTIDRAILKLIAEEMFSGSDFILQPDGICRLNPELTRKVTQEVNQLLKTRLVAF